MSSYLLAQCGGTLAALLVLGAVGGWALFPFRSRERPYLWLATPLAGIGMLSLSLTALYYGCRLTLPVAFGLALALNAAATLLAAWRSGLPRRRVFDWLLGVAALVLLAVGCVRVVQESAIHSGEPTIVVIGGSDQFGYSHVGDWIVRHPHEVPRASPEHPYESWPELMQSDPRPGAFLLAALAGWCRGTTTLFSYDFATGVALCAGLLGFAGAFARRPLTFLLLLAAATVSLWLRNSRTGYFGKTLTYPGYLLLAHLYIQTWRIARPPRVISFVLLSTGFGLTLSPVALLALFGILGGGIAAASLLVWGLEKLRFRSAPARDPGSLWKGAVLALAAMLPVNLSVPGHLSGCLRQSAWGDGVHQEFVQAEALDVSIHWEGTDRPGKLRPKLITAALACTAVAFLWAVACRSAVSAGLLLSTGFVLFTLSRGRLWSVYQFQGLLYPLTLAGALLLIQERAVWGSRWRRLAACCLLLALAAPRAPQLLGTYKQVTGLKPGVPGFLAQSDITAAVEKTQGATVDVCHHEILACLALAIELGARDVPVQFRGPAWQLFVGYRGWPPPHYPRPGDFQVTEWYQGSRPEDTLFAGAEWGLVASEGVWIGQVKSPLGLGKHPRGGYCFHVGAEPAEVELGNGNDRAADVEFVAEAEFQPGPPDAGRRILLWKLAGQKGKLELGPSDREIRLPLRLPPGESKLLLRVERDPLAGQPGGEGSRMLLGKVGLRPWKGAVETQSP